MHENTLADDPEALIVDHPEDPVAFYEIELTLHEDPVSVWEKISITIRQNDLLPVRQVYFDERGEKKRVIKFREIREKRGRRFLAEIEMCTLGKKAARYPLSNTGIRSSAT